MDLSIKRWPLILLFLNLYTFQLKRMRKERLYYGVYNYNYINHLYNYYFEYLNLILKMYFIIIL